jgi:tetratricopeptide (TPR) repeat protein
MTLFRRALELNPRHEDSRYYLANLLAADGDVPTALAELEKVIEGNPLSHRGHKQWGLLKAMHAASPEDMAAAEEALERALEINQEETGSLLALGELALLRGDEETAEERLRWACQSNPRAVGGFFLRAYVSWRRGDRSESIELLQAAQEARGPEWKPEGAVAEGDVAAKMHREESPLSDVWRAWDGGLDPEAAFAPLRRRLETGP